MISYGYLDQILHVSFSGDVSLDQIMGFLKDFEQNKNLPDSLKILFDLSNVQIDLHLEDISLISDRAKIATAKYNNIKTAFFVNAPKATAYTMLFSWLEKSERISREHFSTREAALAWLYHS